MPFKAVPLKALGAAFRFDSACFTKNAGVRLDRHAAAVLTAARRIELVTAIAGRLANVQFGSATRAAFMPWTEGQRIRSLDLRLASLRRFEAIHPASVRLLLSALGVDSTARVARRPTDRAQRPRGRVHLKQRDGHSVISHGDAPVIAGRAPPRDVCSLKRAHRHGPSFHGFEALRTPLQMPMNSHHTHKPTRGPLAAGTAALIGSQDCRVRLAA